MRAFHLIPLLSALLLGQAAAWAQSPAAPAAPAEAASAPARPGSRVDQRIEHIQVEDKDVHIEERRYGGETQSITVQPTNGMPAYEVVPANGARNRPLGERDAASGNSGQRVWKLFNF
ncbi:hypothetical protein RD110_20040 [Rhodoferax koreense]|uniref:DUF2782 domain-containing protein n=1 Tax=Rhodoferax koreensis TaxID=1842727 RepID=A0A1P8JZW3_9BURK|nr:hypothetical protein [Rhodoferax koreense]APW39221.1 hypothetical protein RD110_20040 [Rhodoferax koreense]